jgi:post-segregation antitoxin (ccd killing protein)
MQIELDNRPAEQLEIRARRQGLDINALATEAIEHYLQQLEETDALDTEIDEVMREQAWLLEQLKHR